MKNKDVSSAAKVFTGTIMFPELFITVGIVEFTAIIIHSITFRKHVHTPLIDI